MKKLLLALAAMLPLAVGAHTFGAHLGSVHSAPGFCDFNPGAFVRFDDGGTVGFYRNSECRLSVYAGWTFHALQRGKLSADVTLGAVTGYRRANVLPLAVPSLAYQVNDQVAVRVAYVPKVEKGGAHAVHFMVEVRK
jgi:hypothetical protein